MMCRRVDKLRLYLAVLIHQKVKLQSERKVFQVCSNKPQLSKNASAAPESHISNLEKKNFLHLNRGDFYKHGMFECIVLFFLRERQKARYLHNAATTAVLGNSLNACK